ncbi:MAG: hypothetical protein LBQ84_09245 [Flavobacteriaceae bacterium]|nr:hypothetical protein [Flavobacteriaceae bacterium]
MSGKIISNRTSQEKDVRYSQKDLKQGAKNLVKSLFDMAKIKSVSSKPHSIGMLNNLAKEKLSAISNLPFKDITEVTINPSELRHIFNDHYQGNEKDKSSNIPLSDIDITNLIDIINSPDKIAFLGYDESTQSNKFLFAKESSNGTLVVVEAYGNKGANFQ